MAPPVHPDVLWDRAQDQLGHGVSSDALYSQLVNAPSLGGDVRSPDGAISPEVARRRKLMQQLVAMRNAAGQQTETWRNPATGAYELSPRENSGNSYAVDAAEYLRESGQTRHPDIPASWLNPFGSFAARGDVLSADALYRNDRANFLAFEDFPRPGPSPFASERPNAPQGYVMSGAGAGSYSGQPKSAYESTKATEAARLKAEQEERRRLQGMRRAMARPIPAPGGVWEDPNTGGFGGYSGRIDPTARPKVGGR